MSLILPISMDTEIRQVDPTGDLSTQTSLTWGQSSVSLNEAMRGILLCDLGPLPPTIVIQSANLHLVSPFAGGLGLTTTTFRRFNIVGISDAATWNTKDGVVAWPGGAGGLANTTATNQVIVAYPQGGGDFNNDLPGFLGMLQDAIAAGQPTLAIMIQATEEAVHTCSRLCYSSDDLNIAFHPYFVLEVLVPPETPTYIAPTDGATGQNTCGVTLSWNAAAGATGYNVYLTGPIGLTLVSPNQPGLTYTTPLLDPNTVYHWQIGAVNADGETLGALWSFTTQTALGAATTPSPANNATGVSVTPTFTFTAGAHATSHQLFLYKDGTSVPSTPITDPALPAGTTIPITLQYNTLYHWFVRSTEGCTTVDSATWNFTTTTAPGGAPGLPTNPIPGAVGPPCQPGVSQAITSVAWTEPGDATTIAFSFSADGTTWIQLILQPATGTHAIPGAYLPLLYNHTYYWQVTEVNANGPTAGPIWCFTTEENPTIFPDAGAGRRNRIRPFRRAKDGWGQSPT